LRERKRERERERALSQAANDPSLPPSLSPSLSLSLSPFSPLSLDLSALLVPLRGLVGLSWLLGLSALPAWMPFCDLAHI
jgi:hypothetical protein